VSDIAPLTVLAVCVNHMKHINTLHGQNAVWKVCIICS